jgi:putative ABC transport system permease protein
MAEAAVLGSAGTAIGLGLGLALGDFLVQSAPRYLEDAYGFRASVVVTPSVVLPAVAAGLGATLLATLLPALALLRVPPAEAVRPWEAGHVVARPRLLWAALVAGLLLGSAGVAASLALPGLAIAFLTMVFAGAVLAGPTLFLGAIALLARLLLGSPLRHWAGLTRLAGANLQRSPGRIVATVSACTFSLAMVVAIGGEVDGIQTSVQRFADRFGNFDLYVAATDNSYASVPLPASAADRVRAEPGVAAVHPFRSAFVTWRDRRLYLVGEDPAALRQLGVTFRSGDPAAAVASLDAGGMLISTQVAQLNHLALGDPVSIVMPGGPRGFRVSGVIDELSWPEGTMLIGSGAFSSGLLAPGMNQLLVKVSPGTDPAAVEARLASALPGVVVRTGRGLVSSIASQQSAQVAPFLQVRNVAVLVAALTVLNSLFIAVLGRSREIGIQRAIGALGREVAAALLLEASAMLLVALVAGAGLGVGLQALGTQFLIQTAGLPLRWSLDLQQLLAGGVAALVTVVLGSLYPARLASRVPVLEAIRYE